MISFTRNRSKSSFTNSLDVNDLTSSTFNATIALSRTAANRSFPNSYSIIQFLPISVKWKLLWRLSKKQLLMSLFMKSCPWICYCHMPDFLNTFPCLVHISITPCHPLSLLPAPRPDISLAHRWTSVCFSSSAAFSICLKYNTRKLSLLL